MVEFSSSAKEMIQEALKSEGCDTLKLFLHRSCCGTSLQIELIKAGEEENIVTVDGVRIAIDEETERWTTDKLFDTKKGRLIIRNLRGGCCG